jgi:hypothetical protein
MLWMTERVMVESDYGMLTIKSGEVPLAVILTTSEAWLDPDAGMSFYDDAMTNS